MTAKIPGTMKVDGVISDASASLQVADVIIVSVDTRGLSLARALALKGWKTVVIELSGSSFNSEIEWGDRLGPFLAWEAEGSEAVDREGRPLRTEHASLWLESGPVAFGGRRAEAGAEHLRVRYGISPDSASAASLEKGWPTAMARSLVSSRLSSREKFLQNLGTRFLSKVDFKLPWDEPVKKTVSADAIARARRESAIAAGARVLEAEQISAVRLSDGRVDRVEFKTVTSSLVERTRSLVWMLSEEESNRIEFVGPDVPLNEIFKKGSSEPLMAWWRNRLAVRGLKNSSERSLTRVPATPPHIVVVGSIERPWTHDNIVLLDAVETTPQMRVFDVWTRIPYWARVDHVYRDEQRLLVQNLLSDRFVGCELIWVSPSPLALTAPAIRLAHILYGEASVPAEGLPENICFAGPETWPGVGLRGLRAMETVWLDQLEAMRIGWDPVARLQAGPMERFKYSLKKLAKNRFAKNQKEAAP